METLNKKYVLQMEVLTPLHVGAGAEKDWMHGADFVIHENKVKILNLNKIANFVNVNDLTTALINKDGTALVKKLGANIDKCVDKVFDCGFVGTNDIKTFVKNGLTNQPIVPGSSLKGAIRSILLTALHTKSQITNAKDNSGRWSEQVLFGSASKGDEYFRFIKVSDAEFEETSLVNSKIFNLKSQVGGWKHERNNTSNKFNATGFNTYYEIIEPGLKSLFSISMATKAFENFGDVKFANNKQSVINKDISELFGLINLHTKEYLLKEKAFFQKYSTDKTDNIINSIESLLQDIPENGEYCIFKMSAGSGFHSITGDWQFDDYTIDGLDTKRAVSRGTFKGQGSAKSRKIAVISDNHLCLMGFVKLNPISKEEIQQIETEKLQKELELENQRIAIKAAFAEKIRLETAEKILFEEKRSKYIELLQKTQLIFDKGELDASKKTLDEAIELFPEELAHLDLEKLISNAIAIKIQDEEIQKTAAALEQARIVSNKVPLSEKIAKNDKFATIFGNVKTWMKLNEVEELENEDLEALIAKLTDLYSRMRPNDKKPLSDFKKWSELEKIIGTDLTKQIFNKVVK